MGHDSNHNSRARSAAQALKAADSILGLDRPKPYLSISPLPPTAPPPPAISQTASQSLNEPTSLWTALQSLDAAAWRLDLRSGRVDMTAEALTSFERVFNIDPQCLEEGRFGFALYAHPDDRDRLLAMMAEGLEKSFRTHFRVTDRDNNQRWIQIKVSHVVKSPTGASGDSLWFLAENDTVEKSEQERQKRLLADRILSSLFGADLSQLPPEEFSSIGLMDKISQKWKLIVEDKGIRWMGPDLAPLGPASVIEGSELLLMLMMDSLFDNALEAALTGEAANPWIRFEFFEDNESVFFALSDSGAGVPLVHRGQIFEPFFSTRPESSSGLGLTLARSAAEWHGGQLRLDHFSNSTRLVGQIPKQFRRAL